MSFESVGEILQKNARYHAFLVLGKKVKQWYFNYGYVQTNFGWMHKDWISEAMGMKWIVPSDYEGVYTLCCNYKKLTTQSGVGRMREEHAVEWPSIDRLKAFFRFLETKRAVTPRPSFSRDLHAIFPKKGQQEIYEQEINAT